MIVNVKDIEHEVAALFCFVVTTSGKKGTKFHRVAKITDTSLDA